MRRVLAHYDGSMAWIDVSSRGPSGRRRASRERRSAQLLRRVSVLAGLHRVRLRQRLRVRHVRAPQVGIGLRFVIAADLHADDDLFPAWAVAAVVDAIEAVPAVDAVLMPGDFVGHDPRAIEWCAAELGRISAPTFASLGNHDLEADDCSVRAALEAVGITVLVNEAVSLVGDVWIGGLDSLSWGDPDVRAMERMVPGGDAVRCVVLGHEPALATRHHQRLHVAGHTHNGQVRLPGLPPLVLPSYSRPYVEGLHRIAPRGRTGERWAYTTAGIGSTTLPLRIGAPPEIVVLDC